MIQNVTCFWLKEEKKRATEAHGVLIVNHANEWRAQDEHD